MEKEINPITPDVQPTATQQTMTSLQQQLIKEQTKRKHAEKEFSDLQAGFSRFLTCLSCEIRTPHSAVTGFAELIQLTDANIPPHFYKSLEYIKQNGHDMLILIDDLIHNGTKFCESNGESVSDIDNEKEPIQASAKTTIAGLQKQVAVEQTKQKQTEQKIAYFKKSVYQFVMGIAHKFRYPLGVVIGLPEVIETLEEGLSAEQKNHLVFIKKNGQEILFIVDYLTTIVKVEFNKLALYPIPTDLSELLANITKTYQQMSQTEQQHIYKATALPKSVKVDSKQLKITLELLHDLALNNKADSEKILFTTEATPLSNSHNWQIRFTRLC